MRYSMVKWLLLLIVFFLVLNCNRSKEPYSIDFKYFDPKNLTNLSLESVSYFWQNDTIRTKSDPIAHFRHSFGYLKGIEFVAERQSISIFVFQTKIDALDSMEKYRTLNSRITAKGDKNKYIKEEWWYVVYNPLHFICINKYNTVLCIYYRSNTTNDIIFRIAEDVLNRIEVLSEEKQF